MKKLLFLLAIWCTTLHSQFGPQIEYIIPDPGGTTPGELCFVDTNDYPGALESACIKSPADVTTAYDLTLPAALTGADGCLQVSATGVISITGSACGGAGGSPAGVDRDIQINDSSSFGVSDASYGQIRASGVAGHAGTVTILSIVGDQDSASGPYLAIADYPDTNVPAGATIYGFSSRGTEASPTASQSGDKLLTIFGEGRGTTINQQFKSAIRFEAAETFTDSAAGTRIKFLTTPTSSTTQRFVWTIEPDGTILPVTDSSYDLCANNTRCDQIFGDYGNFEFVEVSNSGHTAHWTLANVSGVLEITDTVSADVLQLHSTMVELYQDLMPDSFGIDIGTVTDPFNEAWVDDLKIEGPDALFPVAWLFEDSGGGLLRIYDDDGGAAASEVIAEFGANNSSDGYAVFYTDDGSQKVEIGATGGGGEADSGYLGIENVSSILKIEMGVNVTSDTFLSMIEDGSGTTEIIRLEAGSAGVVTLGSSGSNTGQVTLFDNATAGQVNISGESIAGSVGAEFSGPIWINDTETTGDGEGAEIIAISIDAADAIEFDNVKISDDGNFYDRVLGSDLGGTACSSVSDGWFAVGDDTTKRLWVCLGGNEYYVDLTAL